MHSHTTHKVQKRKHLASVTEFCYYLGLNNVFLQTWANFLVQRGSVQTQVTRQSARKVLAPDCLKNGTFELFAGWADITAIISIITLERALYT